MTVTIADLMTDNELFGNEFAGESWRAWRALLNGFYGLTLTDAELETFKEITGRDRAPQSAHNELYLVVGRRGGKSQMAALMAVYEAAFSDYSDQLAPGEVATVMVLAADRKQARSVFRYIVGLIESNPMLARQVLRQDSDSITLKNRTSIEVTTASFRSVRGYTVACCIADELAFWRSDESANPDTEILNAIRPAMATLDGKLIALSSPYARRGELYRNWNAHFGKSGPILVAQAPSRTMNPTLKQSVVDAALARDPAAARAEYMAEFRTDVEQFVTLEAIEACTVAGRRELPPVEGIHYKAFVDPSGGSSDAMTLAVSHREKETVILDAVRAIKPPFSPESAVEQFVTLLKSYRINQVTGDRYAGEWPREQFKKRGIHYQTADKAKSDIYLNLLPLINSGQVELLDSDQLRRELVGLERRTSRAGKDSIDHAPGAHDDVINAAAGAIIMYSSSGTMPRVRCLGDTARRSEPGDVFTARGWQELGQRKRGLSSI